MSNTNSGELSQSQERQYAMFTHLGGIILPLIAAIIGYVMFKDKSAYLKEQTTSALNFGISFAIYSAASTVLMVISFGLLFFIPGLVWLFFVIMSILAGIKANNGEEFKYPLSIAFIK